jgi:hypothetical protein
MNTYAILRRSGWKSTDELQEAADRSRVVGDEQMSDDIQAVPFYVLADDGGSVGCLPRKRRRTSIIRNTESIHSAYCKPPL